MTINRGTTHDTTTRADLPRGYSIDLCLEIVDEVMAELELPTLELAFIPTDPGTRFTALSDKAIDIECGTSSITVTRGGKVEFSHVIFVTGTKLLVRSGLAEEIMKAHAQGDGQARELEIEDLDGRRIAAAEGTTNYDALRSIRKTSGLKFDLVSVSDHDQGVDFLLAGEVEAYATDDILLYGLKQKLTTMGRIPPEVGGLEVSGRFLSYDLYALMVRHNDSCFRWIVNKRLSRLFRSGEIGAIYERWFGHLDAAPSRLFKNAIMLQAIPMGK